MMMSRIIAVEHAAEHAEHASFFATGAASTWRRGDDAIGQAREGTRLQNHSTRPCQPDEEQPFAAKQRRLDAGHRRNVVVDSRLERDEAASIDVEHITRLELERMERPRSVQEYESDTAELRENE